MPGAQVVGSHCCLRVPSAVTPAPATITDTAHLAPLSLP